MVISPNDIIRAMGRNHQRTLAAFFSRPVPSGIRWSDAMALLTACGAELEERKGSRIAVFLNDEVAVFHRPHRGNEIDKGAVASFCRFLEQAGFKPI